MSVSVCGGGGQCKASRWFVEDFVAKLRSQSTTPSSNTCKTRGSLVIVCSSRHQYADQLHTCLLPCLHLPLLLRATTPSIPSKHS